MNKTEWTWVSRWISLIVKSNPHQEYIDLGYWSKYLRLNAWGCCAVFFISGATLKLSHENVLNWKKCFIVRWNEKRNSSAEKQRLDNSLSCNLTDLQTRFSPFILSEKVHCFQIEVFISKNKKKHEIKRYREYDQAVVRRMSRPDHSAPRLVFARRTTQLVWQLLWGQSSIGSSGFDKVESI